MRLVYTIITIYALASMVLAGEGFRILNNSDARLSHALADAGISSNIADYQTAKGCE